MQREIPQELPSALAAYYREEVLAGYNAGLARRVCMDFGACVDAPWMGVAGQSHAVQSFLAEVQAFGSFFHETTVYLGELNYDEWAAEARMSLVHEASNKARGVAQAGTALTFGADAERHPGGSELQHKCQLFLVFSIENAEMMWNFPER